MALLLFTLLDPFGLASQLSLTSRNFTHRLMSVASDDGGRRYVTNVLIDDVSVTAINGERGYPLTFAQHAAVLRPVLCARPSALLIDVTFRGLRSDARAPVGTDDPELSELIAVLKGEPAEQDRCRRMGLPSTDNRPRTKVFISRTRSTPPSDCDPFYGHALAANCLLGRQLDRLAAVAEPVSVSPVDADGAYPLVLSDLGNSAGVPLRMAQAFCDSLRVRGALPFLKGCVDQDRLTALMTADVPEQAQRLHPIWSYYQSQTFLDDQRAFTEGGDSTTPARCKPYQGSKSVLTGSILAANEFWHTLIAFGDAQNNRHFGVAACLPQDSFSALDVRQMSTNCGADGTVCRRRLANFFTDRMVFYGIDVTGINDTVASHVLGSVPGVAYLATLSENLLLRGADFYASPPEFVGIGLDKLWDFAAFVSAAFGVYVLSVTWFGRWLAWGLIACASISLGFAWMGDLPNTKTSAASTLILLSMAVMWRGQELRQAVIRCSVALLILGIFGLLGMLYWQFPPTNFIATMLLLSAIPGLKENSVAGGQALSLNEPRRSR